MVDKILCRIKYSRLTILFVFTRILCTFCSIYNCRIHHDVCSIGSILLNPLFDNIGSPKNLQKSVKILNNYKTYNLTNSNCKKIYSEVSGLIQGTIICDCSNHFHIKMLFIPPKRSVTALPKPTKFWSLDCNFIVTTIGTKNWAFYCLRWRPKAPVRHILWHSDQYGWVCGATISLL